jgi:cystathionine beta-lyase family protein involved in aluminum resistance
MQASKSGLGGPLKVLFEVVGPNKENMSLLSSFHLEANNVSCKVPHETNQTFPETYLNRLSRSKRYSQWNSMEVDDLGQYVHVITFLKNSIHQNSTHRVFLGSK